MSGQGLSLIYRAIDELNALSEEVEHVSKSPTTRLFGGDGGIDSLALVNLVVAIENLILDETGKSIVLVHEEVMKLEQNPFHTVETLAKYLDERLVEA